MRCDVLDYVAGHYPHLSLLLLSVLTLPEAIFLPTKGYDRSERIDLLGHFCPTLLEWIGWATANIIRRQRST